MESENVGMLSMPRIWSGQERYFTSKNAVVGAIANWAVRQSPYVCPDNLESAIKEAHERFPDNEEYFETDCRCLELALRDLFERVPDIMAWNKAKKGDAEYVFVSRYGGPKPDYDFIDLSALAANVAHSITLAAMYDKAHEKDE